MQVNLSGHHVEITDAIKTHVKSKMDKIASHYPGIISMTVILGHEKNVHTVEINTTYEGVSIAANAREENLYSAIASAGKKLDASLAHRKGLLKAKQHNKPVLNAADPSEEVSEQEEFIDPQEAVA